MKKVLLIGLAATAMLASCSNDETVEMAQPKAIGFSNAFVNNGTRSINDPSFTTTTLEDFVVYGFTQNGSIFDGVTVEQTITNGVAQGDWTYSPVQYWVSGNTYTFGAIAPATQSSNVSNVSLSDGKVGMEVSFTNNGTVDLLHAAPAAVVCDEAFLASPQKVGMTFYHQLSKVKFSFENAVGEGYNVKVSNVKITDAKQKGTLIIGTINAWSGQDGTNELDFGDAKIDAENGDIIANGNEMESYKEMLMIPTDNTATYTVTFDVYLYHGNVLMNSTAYSHSTTISGVALQLGYCYDFKATLTHENIVGPENALKPIEFEVTSIEGWEDENQNQTLTVPSTSTETSAE